MKWTLFISFGLLFLSSCATFKTKTGTQLEVAQIPEKEGIVHTCFLIGDAGYAQLGKQPVAVNDMYHVIANAKPGSSLFFLGDNVYENGIAEPGHREEILSKHRLQVQIDLAKSFNGQSFFIPGNHDWGFGQEAVLRQQSMVESQLNDEAFLPDDGCPGPVLIELSKKIVAIAFDSEWYLGEWPTMNDLNNHCETNTREKLLKKIENLVENHKDKTILIVMHHPLYSYGPHGGFYSTKDHIFPLTNIHPAIYLPLPIIGSLVALVRRNINRHEDLGHERYKFLRNSLLTMTEAHPRVIFASGHEHTQQWIKKGDKHFIVSGSGSKTDPAKLGEDSLFASGRPGYCALDFYESGALWVRFYSVEKKDQAAQLILHAPVFDVTE